MSSSQSLPHSVSQLPIPPFASSNASSYASSASRSPTSKIATALASIAVRITSTSCRVASLMAATRSVTRRRCCDWCVLVDCLLPDDLADEVEPLRAHPGEAAAEPRLRPAPATPRASPPRVSRYCGPALASWASAVERASSAGANSGSLPRWSCSVLTPASAMAWSVGARSEE